MQCVLSSGEVGWVLDEQLVRDQHVLDWVSFQSKQEI